MIIDTRLLLTKNTSQKLRSFQDRNTLLQLKLMEGIQNGNDIAYFPIAQISEQHSQYLLSYFMDWESVYMLFLLLLLL
jgi:hypothetical protein